MAKKNPARPRGPAARPARTPAPLRKEQRVISLGQLHGDLHAAIGGTSDRQTGHFPTRIIAHDHFRWHSRRFGRMLPAQGCGLTGQHIKLRGRHRRQARLSRNWRHREIVQLRRLGSRFLVEAEGCADQRRQIRQDHRGQDHRSVEPHTDRLAGGVAEEFDMVVITCLEGVVDPGPFLQQRGGALTVNLVIAIAVEQHPDSSGRPEVSRRIIRQQGQGGETFPGRREVGRKVQRRAGFGQRQQAHRGCRVHDGDAALGSEDRVTGTCPYSATDLWRLTDQI